jgi:hypothetical protein
MMSDYDKNLRNLVYALFVLSFVSDLIVLITMMVFRNLHKRGASRVMGAIHLYDALNNLSYAVTYYKQQNPIACTFQAISTNMWQVQTFLWMTVLSVKIYYPVVHPFKMESKFWRNVGSDWRVHLAANLYILALTLIPLEQGKNVGGIEYAFAPEDNYICWLNENLDRSTYNAFTACLFYVYLCSAFVASIYCMLRSFYSLASIDMPLIVRKSLHRLLLYPLALLIIWVPAAIVDFSGNAVKFTQIGYQAFAACGGMLYGVAYWTANRLSRDAWYFLYLDFVDPLPPGPDGVRKTRLALMGDEPKTQTESNTAGQSGDSTIPGENGIRGSTSLASFSEEFSVSERGRERVARYLSESSNAPENMDYDYELSSSLSSKTSFRTISSGPSLPVFDKVRSSNSSTPRSTQAEASVQTEPPQQDTFNALRAAELNRQTSRDAEPPAP